MKRILYLLILILSLSLVIATTTFTCYQEDTVEKNRAFNQHSFLAKDTECGLTYNGGYGFLETYSNSWSDPGSCRDGHTNSNYGANVCQLFNFFENYTKPLYPVSSVNVSIYASSGIFQTTNMEIPSDCYNYDSSKIILRYTFGSPYYCAGNSNHIYIHCYNSTWKEVYYSSLHSGDAAFDESRVYWQIPYTRTCYQETANVSTACGGLATGAYNWTGTWVTPAAINDISGFLDGLYKSDNTQSFSRSYFNITSYIYINYSKPTGATSNSLFTIEFNSTRYNASITNSCFTQSPLQLRVSSQAQSPEEYAFPASINVSCWNGTNWDYILERHTVDCPHADWATCGNPLDTFTTGIYDEAMWWEIDDAPNVTFVEQKPSDLNLSNFIGPAGVNITYNISDPNLNTSTIYLHFKSNSTNSNVMYYQNGTAHEGFFSTSAYVNNGINYTWTLTDNAVLPGTYNYGEVTMENTVHSNTSLSGTNDYLRIELLNVSNTTQYSFFEVMVNYSSGTNPLRIYYCNSSYVSTNPSASIDCSLFYTTTNLTYNHRHTVNSAHIVAPLGLNSTTGMIGSVKVTPTSYFMLRGQPSTTFQYYYITNSSRVGAYRTTSNNGVTWTNQTYTVDGHLHQFSNETSMYYYVCANDTSNNQNCSNLRSDLFELGGLPPSSPSVYSPTNLVYEIRPGSNTIKINYTASVSPNSYPILYYNISLLNSDYSFNKTIIGNNSINLSYTYTHTLSSGQYVIRVQAYDSLMQSSIGYSEPFNITIFTCGGTMLGNGSISSPCNITNCTELQDMNLNLTANYQLVNNVDCSDTVNWNGGTGFSQIGDFNGTLNGRYYNLTSIYHTTSGIIGINNGNIYNLYYKNITASCSDCGLLLYYNKGNISNVSVQGNFASTGTNGYKGGLASFNIGHINSVKTNVTVRINFETVGGILYKNAEPPQGQSKGYINNSYSYLDYQVSGNCYYAGGITSSGMGYLDNSYSTGNIICPYGYYASGGISGQSTGISYNNLFTTVLLSNPSASYNPSYSGGMSGGQFFGGTFTNSYWYNQSLTTSDCYPNGNTGCTAVTNLTYFYNKSNQPLASWDFDNVWLEIPNGYPRLRYEGCVNYLKNTSTDWANISCVSSLMNQTRTLTQYDSNHCGNVSNVTFTEYQSIESCIEPSSGGGEVIGINPDPVNITNVSANVSVNITANATNVSVNVPSISSQPSEDNNMTTLLYVISFILVLFVVNSFKEKDSFFKRRSFK